MTDRDKRFIAFMLTFAVCMLALIYREVGGSFEATGGLMGAAILNYAVWLFWPHKAKEQP